MADALWRLAWALPLVLLTGGVAVLLLKRFVIRGAPSSEANRPGRLLLRESLCVSEQTCVHLIEIDGTPCLLAESSRHATLHAVSSVTEAGALQ